MGDRGAATLDGGDGNDVLWVGVATTRADCGPGADVAYLTPAAVTAQARGRLDTPRIGFAGCETITPGPAGAVPPTLAALADAYRALGVPWDDEIVERVTAYEQMTSCQVRNRRCPGTDAAERIIGTDRADRLAGRGGDDFLEGAGGSDRLDGGRGVDSLFGRTGDDRLVGGLGADELEGGRGDDTLIGGDGSDTINGGFGGLPV